MHDSKSMFFPFGEIKSERHHDGNALGSMLNIFLDPIAGFWVSVEHLGRLTVSYILHCLV